MWSLKRMWELWSFESKSSDYDKTNTAISFKLNKGQWVDLSEMRALVEPLSDWLINEKADCSQTHLKRSKQSLNEHKSIRANKLHCSFLYEVH